MSRLMRAFTNPELRGVGAMTKYGMDVSGIKLRQRKTVNYELILPASSLGRITTLFAEIEQGVA